MLVNLNRFLLLLAAILMIYLYAEGELTSKRGVIFYIGTVVLLITHGLLVYRKRKGAEKED